MAHFHLICIFKKKLKKNIKHRMKFRPDGIPPGWNSARMKFRPDEIPHGCLLPPQTIRRVETWKMFWTFFFCGCWPLAGGSMDSVWRMSMASAQPLPRSGRVNVPCLLTDWNVCVCLSTGRCLLGQHLSVPRSGYFWGATDGRCHLAAESLKIQ